MAQLKANLLKAIFTTKRPIRQRYGKTKNKRCLGCREAERLEVGVGGGESCCCALAACGAVVDACKWGWEEAVENALRKGSV